MLQIVFGKVMLVASLAVDRPLGEWLRVNIKFAQAVDYDVGVNEEYAAGTLSLDNYKNKKQEYDRKIAEVQDKIEQSKVEEAAQSVVPGTVRAAAEQAENFLHGTRLTASMVSAFIENVYVHEGGRIVVQFKYEQSIQDAVRALHTD